MLTRFRIMKNQRSGALMPYLRDWAEEYSVAEAKHLTIGRVWELNPERVFWLIGDRGMGIFFPVKEHIQEQLKSERKT